MQALIPASSGARAEELMTGAGDDDSQEAKEKDRDAAVKSNSSKAATVESANRYIRVLKESDAAQKAAIADLKKELEEMRERLGEKKDSMEADDSADAGAEKATEPLPKSAEEIEDASPALAAEAAAVK